MDNLAQMRAAVQSDLTVGSESNLFPPTTIDLAINRAYRKAGGLHDWPELEDSKKTSTVANLEYYEYPQNWKPLSIWKLIVDSKDYGDPLTFRDYKYEKENDRPSGLTYMWANQWRRYFIYPTPTTNGTNNIEIHGIKNVSLLSGDSDITIFSYSMTDCNEALVLEAVAILKAKGEEEQKSVFRSNEARLILETAWKKVKQYSAKAERTQPIFEVPDYFSTPTTRKDSNIGRFNL